MEASRRAYKRNTYSMQHSPSWEANWFAASQEIPRILWNPKVHYRTHKHPPPVPNLCQPNPVHIPTSHLLEIHPNIIHPSTPSPHTYYIYSWYTLDQTSFQNAGHIRHWKIYYVLSIICPAVSTYAVNISRNIAPSAGLYEKIATRRWGKSQPLCQILPLCLRRLL